ncbi:MAG: metallophosphoesterase [Candidatus Absconditabacterales bacterium]|nr:metallophosphoesterase [Candidatus Absconditabacterales bacterium]
MLLIGDLHINSRIKDRVLEELKKHISNSSEKNIIFLGDYVYHFAYDRTALLSLYTLFLELFSQGKNVYILSGNHDWIGNTFVFEEAKMTYEMITKNVFSDQTGGKIEFITRPKVENIEGEDILFLPYYLTNGSVDSLQNNFGADYTEIENTITTLSQSNKKNEQISAHINQVLLDYIKKYPKLTVIHHYYIEGISFPGQRARFYFNDIALSHLFCDLENIKMISGHLHQGFVYKNYLCTGSVRSTSPLETNHIKALFQYSNNSIKGKLIFINPYFFIDNSNINKINKDSLFPIDGENKQEISQLTEAFVDQFILDTIEQNKQYYLGSEYRKVDFDENFSLDKKDISISLKVEEINYDKIYQHIDQDFYKKLKDFKLKKHLVVSKDLSDKLDIEGKNLSQGFSDRKNLLKEYLKVKYPEDNEKYLDFLRKEKIL